MFKPFAFLLAAIRILITLLLMVLFLLIYIPLSSFAFTHTPARAFKLRKLYIEFITFIFGIRCEVQGKSYEGTALYVCNHRSPLDPVILLRYLNAYVIAKAEVANIPLLHTGAQLTGIIYVQRENKSSRSSVREKIIEKLKEGINILVYPEGTVTATKEILEYKPGTFIEVTKNNIPVVPVMLEYYYEKDLWKGKKMVAQLIQQLGKFSTKTRLIIGPPMRDEDGIALRDKAQTWTQEQIHKTHQNWKGSVFSNS